ncbi:hypothetical protein R5R35_011335 [Gryllus longicercus]|uniref:RNA-directed DNA polymerase n=1 Tax=Gryllus longicercus TaxID=2509291 RepID=A0AAN9ZGG7_9ORTH
MGVEKTTNRARDCMYWPMMFKEIKDKVDSCSVCLCNSKSIQKETLVNRDLPTKPWEIVALDIFQLEKKRIPADS